MPTTQQALSTSSTTPFKVSSSAPNSSVFSRCMWRDVLVCVGVYSSKWYSNTYLRVQVEARQ